MNLAFLRRRRAVGLDVGSGEVRVLALERRRSEVVVVGRGAASTQAVDDSVEMSQAVHAALADAGALGEPVIVAVGSPDVVIRQVSLPPVPRTKKKRCAHWKQPSLLPFVSPQVLGGYRV